MAGTGRRSFTRCAAVVAVNKLPKPVGNRVVTGVRGKEYGMNLSRRVGLAVLVAGAWMSGARNDQWRIIGPGGGGAQFYPAISPHDARKVLVACDMTGAYLTEDAGASWRMFNLRGTTRFFEWDPNDPKTVYAGSGGLFRSADGGKSWALVFPSPARVTGVSNDDDHASGPILVDGKAAQRVTALAIEPGKSQRLNIAIGKSLLITGDAGATWRVEREFPTAIRRIWAARDGLYVAVERSIFRRENGEWSEGEEHDAPFVDVAGAPPLFYGITAASARISDNAGKSWRAVELPGTDARLQAVAASRNHPDTAYLSFRRLKVGDGYWFGVAKTIDRGRTWQLVWKESNAPAANIHDNWIAPRFGPGWGGSPLHLAVSDTDPNICYGTDMGRTLRTLDGGKTWDGVYSKRVGDGWTSTGLDVTTNYGVHFDPFDAKRMFITYTDIGAFRSEDGGKSWVSATDGVPEPWVNTTYWMEFDPEVRGRVWAVASGTHVAGLESRHAGYCRHPHPARCAIAEGRPGVVCRGLRQGRVQVRGFRRHLDAEELGDRRPGAFCVETLAGSQWRALRCDCAAQREWDHWRCCGRRGLLFEGWRGALGEDQAPGGSQRTERRHCRSGGCPAAVSLRVAAQRRAGERRCLSFHRRWRHMEAQPAEGPACLRRDRRSEESAHAVRLRIRSFGVALPRPRRDLAASSGVQL
jgi:hypothetical protein